MSLFRSSRCVFRSPGLPERLGMREPVDPGNGVVVVKRRGPSKRELAAHWELLLERERLNGSRTAYGDRDCHFDALTRTGTR